MRGTLVVAVLASVTMVVLASIVASAVAMDGSGKVAARSAAACEEFASTSLAEAVVDVVVAGIVAAAGAMAAVVAVATSMATFSSGTICAAAVAVLPWEAIAVVPLVSGHRRRVLAFVRVRVLGEQEARFGNG